jgi:hypothetical protein
MMIQYSVLIVPVAVSVHAAKPWLCHNYLHVAVIVLPCGKALCQGTRNASVATIGSLLLYCRIFLPAFKAVLPKLL